MPYAIAQGQKISCDRAANLRKVLLGEGVDLYNGKAALINCRGIGSCGTCAVRVEGNVSPVSWRDRTRRALPPHDRASRLRLACQTQVLGDVRVTKFDGFWGQGDRVMWTPDGDTISPVADIEEPNT